MSYEAWVEPDEAHDGYFTEEQVEEARAEERAAIVAWLRATPTFSNDDPDVRVYIDDDAAIHAANAIERGEHVSPTRKEKP